MTRFILMNRMLLALVCVAAATGVLLTPDAGALEAGAAKVEITPPLGTPLSGYLDRWGRGAVEVHDPLWVRCLYLNDGETTVYLLSADLCVINRELRDAVLERAPADIPRDSIILTATHNHSGTGAMVQGLLFRPLTGRYMQEVLDMTADRFAEAMKTAHANRRRAAAGFTTFQQEDLSTNRRVDGGPRDPQVGVIRVEDADGNALAVIANLAAHPTTVDMEESGLSISADYPGFFYTELERLEAPGCVAMFLNGAQGNQRCMSPGEGLGGWDRTAALGRILAERTHEASKKTVCGDASLHLAASNPSLPPTMLRNFMPSETVLKTLEIDGLLMAFFPGEPCVEIGLSLREQARARGYEAQFSVGLANDHLLYFAPRPLYAEPHYESWMSLYGPSIEHWFYREFGRMMRLGEAPSEPAFPEVPAPESFSGGQRLRLSGPPRDRGRMRGAALRDAIQEAYHLGVVEPVEAGELVPEDGLWALAPTFLDLTPLALPQLGLGVRPLLRGLSGPVFDELEGVSEGAELPFDAAWLVEVVPVYAEFTGVESLYSAPFCTMAAVVGDRAGADDLIVARNLDWPEPFTPVLVENAAGEGRGFVEIAFPWSLGVYSGMNDAGLTICVERAPELGAPTLDGPPLPMLARQVLQNADNVAAALATLRGATHARGYRVLLASPGHGTGTSRTSASAVVLELGGSVTVREPEEGMLTGLDPSAGGSDANANARYQRVLSLLAEERIVDPGELQAVMADADPDQLGRAQIRNTDTRYSVLFLPNSRRVVTKMRDTSGVWGEGVEMQLAEGASSE
jgi:hypothetical protein